MGEVKRALLLLLLASFLAGMERMIEDGAQQEEGSEQLLEEHAHQEQIHEVILQSYHSGEKSMELDDDTLETAVANFASILINFYASWCQHCTQFASVYQEVKALAAEDQLYAVAQVDCSLNFYICNYFSINEYPTLIFLTHGWQFRYRGQPNADTIYAWLNKKSSEAFWHRQKQEHRMHDNEEL